MRPGQVNTFDVQADFLYGAPGSGLTVEADMRITVDAQPFPDFTRYSFGAQEDRKAFEPPFLTLKAPDTDERGKTRLEWAGDIKDTPLPSRAQLQACVFEPGGGRASKIEKDAADAHPQRLSRHPADVRRPLFARGHRT